MPFRFACPNCGVQMLVEDQFEGQSGPCANCGKVVAVTRMEIAPPAAVAPPPRSIGVMLGVLALGGVALAVVGWLFAALVVPHLVTPRHVIERRQCERNLARIGVALQNYHKDYGCFPPAVVVDGKGKPMHSWRVLLLPYLDEQALYSRYDFSQPWDGPENTQLAALMPNVYASPGGNSGVPAVDTSFLAITGEGTAFPPGATVAQSEIRDGIDETVLVVESVGSAVQWMQPEDLPVTRMQFGINRSPGRSLRTEHRDGPHVLMADGRVKQLQPTAPPHWIQAMTTIAGNERIDWSSIEARP